MELRVLGVLAALLLLVANTHVQGKVAELSSSIILMGAPDYVLHGNTSHCTNMVDRAAAQVNSRLNFVPTLFWVDKEQASGHTVATSKISYYCFKRVTHADGSTTCKSAEQQDVEAFRQGMMACFVRAVEYNMTIHITPQLNDGTGQNTWQNILDFQPLLDYEDFSYGDVMLGPLAEAVNAAVDQKTKVYFALQGQMGLTLFNYPLQWLQMAGSLYQTVHKDLPSDWPDFLSTGISLHFNRLCGCILTNVSDPALYSKLFPAAVKSYRHHIDAELMEFLFSQLDFISILGLAPLSTAFSLDELQHTVKLFAQEVAEFGVDLHQRLQDASLELHWADVGLGGGAGLGTVATSAAETAKHPLLGWSGGYKQSRDPWHLHALNTTHSPARTFTSYFYNQTAEYLWKQHEFEYQVDAAFLRNYGSWDIQAIHEQSSNDEGSYYFPLAAETIRHHNWRAQRLTNLVSSLGERGVRFLFDSRQMQFAPPVPRHAVSGQARANHIASD